MSPTLLGIAIVLLVAVIYAPVQSYQFITLDDPQYVSANPVVGRGLTRAGIAWAFAFNGSFYWHPLTWISHMLDVEIFGLDAGAHHLVNVAFHAAASVLLFASLRRLTGKTVRSAMVAAIFAIHPLHVESVAWISERKDVLSTFFLMIALYFYGAYIETRRFRTMAGVTAAFAAGLLAKPMILTLPFILLLLDYWPLRRFDSSRAVVGLLKEKLPLFTLAAASLAVTLFSQRDTAAVVSFEALTLTSRITNAIVSYALYLRDAVWPFRLAAFYPFVQPSPLTVAGAAALLVLLTVAAVRFRRDKPYLLVGWLWFLGTLVPVIGLLQAGDQGRADRFTYIPLIGPAIAITWFIGAIIEGSPRLTRGLVMAAGAAAIVGCAVISRNQLSYWRDDLALWGRAVTVTSKNYRAENHFGVALTDRGRLDEGTRHYEAALRIWPDYPEAHNNLGTARLEQGRIDDAIAEFAEAARLKPSSPTFHYNLAVVLSTKGDTAAAIASVKRALDLNPENPQYRTALQVLGGN